MSMHKKELTELERSGMEAHGLPIGTASQCSDSFRNGVYWANRQLEAALEREAELAACVEKFQRLADNDRVDDEFYDEDGDLRTGNGWKSKLGRDLHLALQGAATVILAKRDLIKQAEIIDTILSDIEPHDSVNWHSLTRRAEKLRQQAESLK